MGRRLTLAVAPWVLLGGLSLLGLFTGSLSSVGLALVATGGLLVVKQVVRYPSRFVEVDEVAGLLERVDASPVRASRSSCGAGSSAGEFPATCSPRTWS